MMARQNNARRWDCTKITSWIALLSFVLTVVLPLPALAGDAVFYYHNDATGSPVAVTNSAGTKVWGADYEPFGELAGVIETVPNNQQFLAKTVDPETSLHLLGARYYDGKLGRFLSVDPVLFNGNPASARQLPQRFNLYAYSTNNPYRYADPNGQFLIPVIVAVVAATAFFPSTVNTPQDSADALHDAQTNLEFGGAILLSELGGAVTAKGLGILGGTIGSRLSGLVGRATSKSSPSGLPSNADDLLNQGYKEISHPDAVKAGHRTFHNPTTGDKVRFDKGKPGESGFKKNDGYHRENPNKTGDKDLYLDKQGNPVAKGSRESHLFPGNLK
jgi:RHS repeat-associated protein